MKEKTQIVILSLLTFFIFIAAAIPAYSQTPAEMQSPSPGSVFEATTVTFTWNDSGADQYYLHIGTDGPGSHDLYSGGQGTNTSKR